MWAKRPHLRPFVLGAGALAALAALVSAPSARGIGAPDAPCREAPCMVSFRVGTEEMKWRSIETFYPNNEDLSTRLKARGRRLRVVETWGRNGCRNAYRGSGIVAVVKACGDETPLRVRAYRMRGKRLGLTVAYEARPRMGETPD